MLDEVSIPAMPQRLLPHGLPLIKNGEFFQVHRVLAVPGLSQPVATPCVIQAHESWQVSRRRALSAP